MKIIQNTLKYKKRNSDVSKKVRASVGSRKIGLVGVMETRHYFNGALLTAYLYLLNPYCCRTKKEQTDPGTSMDQVDSELVKRLRGNLTEDSHVTAQARH